MAGLFDVLRGMPRRQEFGTLDTAVDNALGIIAGIEILEPSDGSRIRLHLDALKQFLSGVNDGYSLKASDAMSMYYKIGNNVGTDLGEKLKYLEAHGRIEGAESFKAAHKQLTGIISALIEEFGVLEQARDYPYNFLVSHISDGVSNEEKAISKGLVQMLSSYKDVVENLAKGLISPSDIEKLERKEKKGFWDYVKLGMIYFFRGDVYITQRQFLDATRVQDNELTQSVKDVGHNINHASKIFEAAYSRISLAHQFEASGSQPAK